MGTKKLFFVELKQTDTDGITFRPAQYVIAESFAHAESLTLVPDDPSISIVSIVNIALIQDTINA